MFAPQPQLASDLEYLLLSGQAGLPTLAEALISEAYAPLYCLGLAVCGEPAEAQAAALATLRAALLEAYRYPAAAGTAADGLERWLYGLALNVLLVQPAAPDPLVPPPPAAPVLDSPQKAATWQALDRLDPGERLLLALHYVLGWSTARLAALLAQPEAGVASALEQAARQCAPDEPFAPATLPGTLPRTLAACWPAPRLEGDAPAALQRALVAQATAARRRARWAVTAREIGLVGLAALLVSMVFMLAGRLAPSMGTPTPHPARRGVATRPAIIPSPGLAIGQEPGMLIATHTPGPTPTASTPFYVHPYPPFPAWSTYTVGNGESLAGIARRSCITLSDLARVNHLPLGAWVRPGQPLWSPCVSQLQPLASPLPAPDGRATPPADRPRLLPASSLSRLQAVLEGMQDGKGTIWFDAWSHYAPRAYRGPTQAYHLQAWIDGQQALLLAGRLNGPPVQAGLSIPWGQFLSGSGDETPWFAQVQGDTQPGANDLWLILDDLLALPYIQDNQMLSTEKVAGRDAFRLDWTDTRQTEFWQVWLDVQTGLPLRQQRYRLETAAGRQAAQAGTPLAEDLVYEASLTQVTVNATFSPDLFDPRLPWAQEYASDFTGQRPTSSQPVVATLGGGSRPAAPHNTPVPADFDLAASPLSFETAGQTDIFDRIGGRQGAPYSLYAGSYDLGSFTLSNPAMLLCRRSPDGRRLAFSSRDIPLHPSVDANELHLALIDLHNPKQPAEIIPPVVGYDFAFSPDSLWLAFFGAPDGVDHKAVYRMDAETGEYQQLLELPDAYSLAWSPDGKQLALMSGYAPDVVELRLIDAQTGEIAGRWAIAGLPANDWPTHAWGIPFPNPMGGLDDCAAPGS